MVIYLLYIYLNIYIYFICFFFSNGIVCLLHRLFFVLVALQSKSFVRKASPPPELGERPSKFECIL